MRNWRTVEASGTVCGRSGDERAEVTPGGSEWHYVWAEWSRCVSFFGAAYYGYKFVFFVNFGEIA